MEKNFTDSSIINTITSIYDLHLKLIDYLSIEQVVALTEVSKHYYDAYNSIPVWKQLLREDFNWPSKRRGKGSKKQAKKQKQEMELADYKAVYVQKYRAVNPKGDEDLVTNMMPVFFYLYKSTGWRLNLPTRCTHPHLRFAPANLRKPLFFGCEACLCRIQLKAGLTKGQIRQVFQTKDYYKEPDLVQRTICSWGAQVYRVKDLDQR